MCSKCQTRVLYRSSQLTLSKVELSSTGQFPGCKERGNDTGSFSDNVLYGFWRKYDAESWLCWFYPRILRCAGFYCVDLTVGDILKIDLFKGAFKSQRPLFLCLKVGGKEKMIQLQKTANSLKISRCDDCAEYKALESEKKKIQRQCSLMDSNSGKLFSGFPSCCSEMKFATLAGDLGRNSHLAAAAGGFRGRRAL